MAQVFFLSYLYFSRVQSTNGTFLNGVRLEEGTPRELRFGDILGAGLSHLESEDDLDVTSSEYFVFKFEKV